jgi:RNA polymerase sigma-70 factor (ECF subfamily)
MGSDSPGDAELVARAKAGDEPAFRLLHDRHAARRRQRVRRRMSPALRRRVAESDVVQESFAEAFRSLPRLRDAAGFAGWLATIADRKVNEVARRHFDADKRAVARELSRDRRAETAQFAAADPSPSEAAIAGELDASLTQALAGLPEDFRTILRLVHEEGRTLAEAGAAMGRSAEAARKLYGRALDRLAEGVFGPRKADR